MPGMGTCAFLRIRNKNIYICIYALKIDFCCDFFFFRSNTIDSGPGANHARDLTIKTSFVQTRIVQYSTDERKSKSILHVPWMH